MKKLQQAIFQFNQSLSGNTKFLYLSGTNQLCALTPSDDFNTISLTVIFTFSTPAAAINQISKLDKNLFI